MNDITCFGSRSIFYLTLQEMLHVNVSLMKKERRRIVPLSHLQKLTFNTIKAQNCFGEPHGAISFGMVEPVHLFDIDRVNA